MSTPAEPDSHPAGRNRPPLTAVPALRASREPDGVLLSAVFRVELEDVLQSIYAARQDVLEHDDVPDPAESRRSAERTLQGCATTVQLLLRFLREMTTDSRQAGVMRMMAGPYGILRTDGEALYFNSAFRSVVGIHDRRSALRRLQESSWIDRHALASHLAVATRSGEATMETSLIRSGGEARPIRLTSVRIDDEGGALFLVGVSGADRSDAA